ncbi:MAG: hypothetical protein Q8R90_08010 [Bacteroidales bacterium]|nr:hypothetical protein [Bacteroidales bacterium]
MIFKELVNNFYISEQCCKMEQKMLQISNDLKLGRKHDTNIQFLEDLICEMDAIIIVRSSRGECSEGYEGLKKECENLIEKICQMKNSRI